MPKNRLPACLLTAVVSVVLTTAFAAEPAASVKDAAVQVYFSPFGGAQDAIVNTIAKANSSVLVQAYSFGSLPIAQALIDAHKRGVRVQVLLDPSHAEDKKNLGDFIARAGIPVKIDAAHAKAHNKIMVIDEEIVITGSYNFHPSSEDKVAENLVIVTSKDLAAAYVKNWQQHAEHSKAP